MGFRSPSNIAAQCRRWVERNLRPTRHRLSQLTCGVSAINWGLGETSLNFGLRENNSYQLHPFMSNKTKPVKENSLFYAACAALAAVGKVK